MVDLFAEEVRQERHDKRGLQMRIVYYLVFFMIATSLALSDQSSCVLHISADRYVFTTGEPIKLNISLMNSSQQKLRLLNTSPREDYELVVKDGAGNLMPLTRLGQNIKSTRHQVYLHATTTSLSKGMEIKDSLL